MTTNTGLALQQYALHLGIMPAATMPEQLELQPLPSEQMAWRDATVQCAFSRPYCPDELYNDRLLTLLDTLLAKLPARPAQQIVYLLLPEFIGPDNPQLTALLQQLMRRCPHLLQSERSRVFPYGSAACLMALSAAVALLNQGQAETVWLIAVDSLCTADAFDAYQAHAGEHVLSEGALALCIRASDSGVMLKFSAADALAGQQCKAEDLATASVFRQSADYAHANGETFNLLYLPDCGDDIASAGWLAQYHWLHGAITQDTAYCLPSYYTGELGACGGLYRLLHLLLSAQKGRLNGPTLQFEQSAQNYRSVALLAPTQIKND